MYTQNITVKCDCVYFFIPGQNITTVTKLHTLRQRKIKYISHPDCDVMREESLYNTVSSFLQSLIDILCCFLTAASTASGGLGRVGARRGPRRRPGPRPKLRPCPHPFSALTFLKTPILRTYCMLYDLPHNVSTYWALF